MSSFKVIGIHPDPIVNHLLHEYDALTSDQDKANFLKNNNKPFEPLKSSDKAEEFASGNTIDINPGELLGIGMVAMYYNWTGEKKGNTYQVITGVQDTVKSYKEALLSDGAIWHDQTSKKMLFQTTMAQGFVPKKVVTAQDVADRISDKVGRRSDYADNCGLIINIFSEKFEVDLNEILKLADTSSFTETYIVFYDLPSLKHARVARMSHLGSPELTLKLQRHPRDSEWRFNRV